MPDHDHGLRLLFSHAEMVRDLLTGFVDEPWVHELEFDTLRRVNASYVADDLRDREGDLVWRVRLRGQELVLYLLLEFQSRVDRHMALRMLTYLGLLYQDLLRQGSSAKREAGRQAKREAGRATAAADDSAPARGPALLPPVLPIVLHHGPGRWTAATQVADLITPPPGRLAVYTPRLNYLLLDEETLDETGPLALKNLAAALFALDKSAGPARMKEVISSLMAWLGHPGQDSLRRAFAVYLRRVLLPARAPGIRLPDAADLMELNTMLNETFPDWSVQYVKQGRQEGKAEVLGRQLTRRFGPLPPAITSRLTSATADQLDQWSDRVLDAPTLDAVFDGH